MNATSEPRADATRATPAGKTILVWDAPVRAFHWLLVLCLAGAFLTAESERWRLVHVSLGYTTAGLVGFRILWGLIGTRYARFASFVRGPGAVARYLDALHRGRPERHLGHNPAGALAITIMLALVALAAASGWAANDGAAGRWWGEVHEAVSGALLWMVALHVAGVLVGSWMHRENLVASMISGRKAGQMEQGIPRAWRSVAALMAVAVLGFWWTQWNGSPSAARLAGANSPASAAHADDDD
jgi:cytochrome b